MNTCNMTKIRNTNIEILKFVLMVSIFSWHILVHGYGFKNINMGDYMYDENIGIILSSLFAPATYCFMFISGYYGINFSVKKIVSIEFWMIVVSVLTTIADIVFFNSGGFITLICSFFPLSTSRWWFMTNYMLIFLLSPIFNNGIENLSKRTFKILVLSLIAYQVISMLRFQNNGGSNFLGLFTIFLLGRYCNIYAIEFRKNISLFSFLLAWLSLVALMITCNKYSQHNVFVLLNYNTPFIMLMAVALFYFVKNIKPRYELSINKLLKPNLFIYLVTDGLYVPFYMWIVSVLNQNIGLGLFICLLTIIISLLVGCCIMYVTRFFFKKFNLSLSHGSF